MASKIKEKIKCGSCIFTVALSGIIVANVALLGFRFVKNSVTDYLSNTIQVEHKTEQISELLSNQNTQIKEPLIIERLEPKSATVTFVGDMMFDRHVRAWANRNSYNDLFKHVSDRFHKSDLVVANLEGPITNYNTIYTHGSIPYNYTFTFDPKIASVLRQANIGVVSLDNNHIFDYGREGARQTMDYLGSEGISYFGHPDNREILYKTVNGITFAFLSYNQFILPDLPGLLENIKKASQKSDYTVVFPHWGNEYELVPTQNQISLARQFIDHGADLVIGAHPHVIQSKEIYKGKYIYYSLGNFIFDQYFSEDVKCGAIVTFKLTRDRILEVKEEFSKLSADRIVELSDCATKVPLLQI